MRGMAGNCDRVPGISTPYATRTDFTSLNSGGTSDFGSAFKKMRKTSAWHCKRWRVWRSTGETSQQIASSFSIDPPCLLFLASAQTYVVPLLLCEYIQFTSKAVVCEPQKRRNLRSPLMPSITSAQGREVVTNAFVDETHKTRLDPALGGFAI